MKKTTYFLLALTSLVFSYHQDAQAFTDVAGHPNEEAITFLEDGGVIEGYSDGTFRPDQLINRVEALKMLLLGSNIVVPEIAEEIYIFPDVPYNEWYAKYVNEAKKRGIMSGDDDTGLLRPDDNTKKAEILKMLLKTNQIEVPFPAQPPYLDVSADAWFAPYFDYARQAGLLDQTSGENVYPGARITRGFMAELMYRLSQAGEHLAFYEEGEASYYGMAVHGNGTASGEIFDAYALTAAHPSLPFGTLVLVTNLDNGKQVTVRINDRGPYSPGRIIDLSEAAFKELSPLSAGVIRVSIQPPGTQSPLKPAALSCSDVDQVYQLSKDSFNDIHLDHDFLSAYLSSEALHLTGYSTGLEEDVTAFLMDEKGRQYTFTTRRDASNYFEIDVFFPHPGSYKFGMLPGRSGSIGAYDLAVLSEECYPPEKTSNLPALSDFKAEVSESGFLLSWHDDEQYELSQVNFSQGNREVIYTIHTDEFTPNYADFDGWEAGEVTVTVTGAHLDENSLLKMDEVKWSRPVSAEFKVMMHHDYFVNPDAVVATDLPLTVDVGEVDLIRFDPLVNVNADGLVILPNGQVERLPLTSPTHEPVTNTDGVSVFPASTQTVDFSFTPQRDALHFYEVNDQTGEAVFNIPIYPKAIYPLLPNPNDLAGLKPVSLSTNVTLLQTQMLNLVNEDRLNHGLAPLTLDPKLSALAQSRTDDMASNDYFSHWNLEGLTANDLRLDFGIVQYVAENIARDEDIVQAHYGLMRSASHRDTILDSEWERVGFGITPHPDQGYLFAQIFSDDPVVDKDLNELRTSILEALNENRSIPLRLNNDLNGLAQDWSTRMAQEDFFDLTASNGDYLIDQVNDAGFNGVLGTYLGGNSRFEAATENIANNDQMQESRWSEVGIGIAQGDFGIIKITMTYIQ